MTALLALAFLAVSGPVRATEPPRPAGQEEGSAQRLVPELARLDQVLTLAQKARDEGSFPPERYAEFLNRFRPSLEKARELTPPSPAATALYARILARLGEPQQAANALEPALKERPDDAELRVALGHIRYQQRDYATALAEAEAALAREPGNQAALALKYLSKGRTSGDVTPAQSLPPSGMEAPSVLQDPRLLDAGLKAMGRRNALQFTDEAMRRIKIQDPQEALRYLALAEASDPNLPDVPMQQGIAYHSLRKRSEAIDSFGRAETLWRAQGIPKGDQLADIARQGREAVERLAAQSWPKDDTAPESPSSELPPWTPLAAGGLLLTTMGAYGYERSRRTYVSETGLNPEPAVAPDQASRNWFASAAVVGAGLVALAAWEFGPGAFTAARALFTAAGPSLTPATGTAVALEPAVAVEGTKALGAAVAATGGAKLASDRYSYAKGGTAEVTSGGGDHPNGVYEPSPKHGSQARGGPEGKVSAAPKNGQGTLDNSIQVKSTSSQRIGVDLENDEYVVFREHLPGRFHGYVNTWEELGNEMRSALIRAGRATSRGRIIKR